MKAAYVRFTISFILLITFSGWIFYSGWISLKLKEGESAVIYSKTSGYNSEVLTSGDFCWIWQSVIPGNVTLKKFINTTTEHQFKINVKLPSAEYYSEWLQNNKESFSIILEGQITFSESNENIAEAIKDQSVSNNLTNNQIDSIISSSMIKTYENFDIYNDYPLIPELVEDLKNELKFHLPDLNISILNIFAFSFPDKDLYKLSKKISEERELALNKEELKKIEYIGNWERTQSEKFELLKEYGEIFKKYPELLDFFNIHNAEKLDIITLKQILPTISHPPDSQEPVVP